ncbi:MAG: hypothetical protein ACXVBB_15085, partial [Isosphaeraceae bacterium]
NSRGPRPKPSTPEKPCCSLPEGHQTVFPRPVGNQSEGKPLSMAMRPLPSANGSDHAAGSTAIQPTGQDYVL